MQDSIDNLPTFDSDFTPTVVELKEGQFLGENKNYRLEKNLGAGGMGEVWLATEIRGGMEVRKVVVKTLRPDRRGYEGAQEKALKQFQLIQSLNHTNICPIYVIEKDPACGYLIVMGYANGGSYADWFKNQRKQNGDLPLETVCEALRPIAEALDYAHQFGVIHRDVKPENMMFTQFNGVQMSWLIDFGIAANLRTVTQATMGQFSSSGTDQYMAPEQKKGEFQTAQTDEYSLAMVALEFLAGSLSPLAFSRLSPEIQTVLETALSETPGDRFSTCRELIDALAGTMLPASSNSVPNASTTSADRTAKKARDQQFNDLQSAIMAEYQTGSYDEAISHMNELLKLDPNASPEWLLGKMFKNGGRQKQEKAERNARRQAEHNVREVVKQPEHEDKDLEEAERREREFFAREAANAGKRKVLTADGIEYAFRWCPPGEFMMGSNSDRYNYDEMPVHKVKLTKGFWMLETQVTQEMWKSVMGKHSDPFGRKVKQYPAVDVSWNNSQSFCQKLSQKLGLQVQLPTEAQWEYACRAGTTGDYAGDLDSIAWYTKEMPDFIPVHAVGQKKPNTWGLYDMHGNVCEWCSDYYDADYYSKSPKIDPENTKPSEPPSYRVARGGSWGSDAKGCRSASRYSYPPNYGDGWMGLRIILAPDQKE